MRFIQEIAETGVLLNLIPEMKLLASGSQSWVEDWKPYIRERFFQIRRTLLLIESTYGPSDPLGLELRVDKWLSDEDQASYEEFQSKGLDDVQAIIRRQKEWDEDYREQIYFANSSDEAKGIQPRCYDLLSTANLAAMPRPRYRVKNVFPQNGISVIFGAPGTGKAFLAFHLAFHLAFAISEGTEWFGASVEPCDVLYVCLEGQGGLPQRIQAHCEYHGVEACGRLEFITAPFSLLYRDDTSALIRTLHNAGIVEGVIIIDTLSAATAGFDENSSADMGKALEALRRIQEEFGGHVILVHHSGKDATKGLRGHSSLLAALDVVIQVSRDNDRRSWTLVKAKDGLDGGEHPFQLSVVDLGVDEDGDPITSCAIVPGERNAESSTQIKRPRGGNQKMVYEVIGELLRKATNFGQGEAPASHPCIRKDEVLPACRGRLLVPNDRLAERVRDAVTGLINSGSLMLREEWIWHR